ncbi:hypothetical protein LCGC14_1079130 [marine sediment metagenome]|uniref:Uncharacterized protein n=1 Tax=marine sediment metagenome TaxID=412755 RepID=A0A0F9N3D0_9ZZZZ
MHKCTGCKHTELKYCEQCDKVYCKCGREWGDLPYLYYQPFTHDTTTTIPYDTCDVTDTVCTHSH